MASADAQEWVREHVKDVEGTMRECLAAFRRHGWTAADLDYLLYEAQSGDPGGDDPEFAAAMDTLSRLREAGVAIK
jgi:hypothetical protein